MSHNVALPDGQSLKFEIWDTAGQVGVAVDDRAEGKQS